MREWIPVPGTAKARLVAVAIARFEADGYEGVGVTALARAADVTTGSLYHHFESKLGLYLVVREEMERRIVDRMDGAAAVAAAGRPRVRAALGVAFDAAVHFGVCRILAEPVPVERDDPVAAVLRGLVPEPVAADVLAAAWRASLLAAAGGGDVGRARAALDYVLG